MTLCLQCAAPFDAVAIEDPFGQQQRRALVVFSKGLGTGNPEQQLGSRVDGVRELGHRGEDRGHATEIVRLVEPLVVSSYRRVDRNDEVKCAFR